MWFFFLFWTAYSFFFFVILQMARKVAVHYCSSACAQNISICFNFCNGKKRKKNHNFQRKEQSEWNDYCQVWLSFLLSLCFLCFLRNLFCFVASVAVKDKRCLAKCMCVCVYVWLLSIWNNTHVCVFVDIKICIYNKDTFCCCKCLYASVLHC